METPPIDIKHVLFQFYYSATEDAIYQYLGIETGWKRACTYAELTSATANLTAYIDGEVTELDSTLRVVINSLQTSVEGDIDTINYTLTTLQTQIDETNETIGGIAGGWKGNVKIADPAPTVPGIYTPTESGTYTNLLDSGGQAIVVDLTASAVTLTRDANGVWTKILAATGSVSQAEFTTAITELETDIEDIDTALDGYFTTAIVGDTPQAGTQDINPTNVRSADVAIGVTGKATLFEAYGKGAGTGVLKFYTTNGTVWNKVAESQVITVPSGTGAFSFAIDVEVQASWIWGWYKVSGNPILGGVAGGRRSNTPSNGEGSGITTTAPSSYPYMRITVESIAKVKDDIADLQTQIDAVAPEYTIEAVGGGKNLFNKATSIDGSFVSATGVITTNSNYSRSDKIPVTVGQPVSYIRNSGSQAGVLGAYYGSTGNFISAVSISTTSYSGYAGTVPVGATYFIANISKETSTRPADKNAFQLEYNSAPTLYEPYLQAITEINGNKLYAVNGGGGGSEPTPVVLPTRNGIAFISDQQDDVVFRQPEGATTGLTISGTTVSGTTLTLAGSSASVELSNTLAFAYRQDFIAEAVVKCAATNKLNFQLRNGSTTLANFRFDPSTQAFSETVSATSYTPGNNLDLTQEVRVRLYFDTLLNYCFLELMYYNSAGTNVTQQQHYYTANVTLSALVNRFAITTDAAGTGNATVRNLIVGQMKGEAFGSSILAGSGTGTVQYNPVPRYKVNEVIQQQLTYWLESSSAFKKIWINNGIASGDSSTAAAYITNALRFKPRILITDFGITNDIEDGVLTDSQTKDNIDTIVTACEGQNVLLIALECLPRNAFSAADAERALATNTYLKTVASSVTFMAVADLYSLFLGIGTDINALYANDGTHPNPYGKFLMCGQARIAMSNI